MSAESLISSGLRFKGKLASAGVALSFAVIIISIAISQGFRAEIRNAVNGICADVQLPADADTSALSSVAGIVSVDKVSYRSGIVRKGETIHGVMIKGISSGGDSLSMAARVPESLADMLGFEKGDRMQTYFVSDRIQARNFTIADIFRNPVEVGDFQIVYASYDDMARIQSENSQEEYEIRLEDRFRGENAMRDKALEISFATGSMASASCDRYANIFDWLQLIDANVVAILVLMSLVAGFNMISALLILLFRSTSTIGILKTMGMNDKSIAKVFLRMSSTLVLKGMLVGNAVGLAFCFIQKITHIIKLDPVNYFVSFVPIELDIFRIVVADALAFVVIMLMELLPTLFISKVDPSRTVRVR